MRIEEIKNAVSIEEYAASVLQRSGRSYICPCCSSGNKVHGTSAVSFKNGRFHCFSCHASGDVLDLAGIVNGTDDKAEQKQIVMDWAGIADRENPRPLRAKTAEKPAKTSPTGEYDDARATEALRAAAWRDSIGDPEAVAYLEERGWSADEARTVGMGYDADRKRLILPWKGVSWYHIDRDVTGTSNAKYTKPKASEVGAQPIYNAAAANMGRNGVVFVVEGVMDALAVERCGHEAIALGSTSDANHELRSRLKAAGSGSSTVVVMLDADKAGQEGAARLIGELREAGIQRVVDAHHEVKCGTPVNLFESCKDPDEYAMTYGSDALGVLLDLIESSVLKELSTIEEQEYQDSMARMNIVDPVDVMQSIYRGDNAEEPVPTGLAALDDALDGGLRRGVVVLGAISSMGKTTLALQIADSLMEAGHSVLFVTIEQSAEELVAKSLSRIMRKHGYAVPDRVIRSKEREAWGSAKRQAFWDACQDYANMSNGRLKILEGVSQPSVDDIAAVAERMAAHDGQAPFIFIDYMQLLKPKSDRDTDKQAVDRNVTELRQLVGRLKTTAIVISSLNRSSYKSTIELDSFKESGAIEYGSDVLLGLQPYNMRERIASRTSGQKEESRADEIVKETKVSVERELEIVVLKNRSGRIPPEGVPVTYIPVSNVIYSGTKDKVPDMKAK